MIEQDGTGTPSPGPRARLRQKFNAGEFIVIPSIWDPLSARIAEALGYDCVGVGGYALGAHMMTSEPLLTMTEVVDTCRRITAAVDIAVKVDMGAGFGEPLHIMRSVREAERAGVAALHIEDQIYPKRAHYHQGVEHVVSREEAMLRIKTTLNARTDPDTLIIGRTDAMRTDGYAEGVARANLYLEAGADIVFVYPNSVEEARNAPKDINGPVSYLNSEGNRLGRPLFSLQEIQDMGYRMANYSATLICVMVTALEEVLTNIKSTGLTGLDPEKMITTRKHVEDLIGLERYYEIERQTVEH